MPQQFAFLIHYYDIRCVLISEPDVDKAIANIVTVYIAIVHFIFRYALGLFSKGFKMNKSALVVPYCFFFLVGFSVPCIATAEVSALVNAENQAVVTDGLGVELRFDRAGNLLSVKSTYSHPVEFRDRRGINKAYLIAEEKAKGNIARYLNQVVTSTRTVSEIDESLSKSARTRGSSGELWSKDNTRSVTESIREITSSSASAILKGVRILENRYDPKAEEVTVVVGVNRESLAGANQLGRGLSGSSNLNGEQAGGGSFPSAGAETRRSRDAERF